jgi:DNA gyrase subunit A
MLSLRRALQHYVEHRREIIRRRSEHDLRRARERAHILEGLLKALDIMDEVIQTIRRSQTTDTARANLIKRYGFSELQAQAILDMPLKRLAALERKKLQDEYAELLKRIAFLEDLLAHPDKVLGVIKEELLALKQQYNDPRRTQIVELGVSRASLTVQDMMADEPVLVALAGNGVLLRESMVERRRGKLPSKVDDAAPVRLAAGRTHDEVLLFSADGRMARVPVHRLPDGNPIHPADLGVYRRNDRLVSLLLLGKPEEEEEAQEQYLVLATRQGRVKRVTLAEARGAVGVVTAMNVEDGDELVGAAISDGSSEIVLVSKLAQAIRFAEADVRPMGLPAAGVWGMKLSSGDEVAALAMARPNADLVIATTAGVFKRTPMSEFPVQGRHGGGVAATRLAQKSGAIADAVVAEPADEFFSASRKGTLRKLDYAEIPGGKRSAQGKLLIQPAQGDTIAALLHLPTARSRRAGPRRSGGAAPTSDRPADAPSEPEEAEVTQLTLGGWVEPEPAVKPPSKPKSAAPPAPAAKSQPVARGFKLDEVTTAPVKPASRAPKAVEPKATAKPTVSPASKPAATTKPAARPAAASKSAARPAAKSSASTASKPTAKPAAGKSTIKPKPAAKSASPAKSGADKKPAAGSTKGRK